jgi:hypothetical protein
MTKSKAGLLALALLACFPIGNARAETPEEWIALGARVHGAFGAFIPLGIKIGLDAVHRLNVKPRELSVRYYDSVPALPTASPSPPMPPSVSDR